mmetsp:Transcript_7325/g.16192  ORF Transcript_7325/g.16192 Transcript_7325/m.16192 type:complete len:89 (+) Transcript_7325:38-304(+)
MEVALHSIRQREGRMDDRQTEEAHASPFGGGKAATFRSKQGWRYGWLDGWKGLTLASPFGGSVAVRRARESSSIYLAVQSAKLAILRQ